MLKTVRNIRVTAEIHAYPLLGKRVTQMSEESRIKSLWVREMYRCPPYYGVAERACGQATRLPYGRGVSATLLFDRELHAVY